MMYAIDDDESEFGGSIHNLDNAPAPPERREWGSDGIAADLGTSRRSFLGEQLHQSRARIWTEGGAAHGIRRSTLDHQPSRARFLSEDGNHQTRRSSLQEALHRPRFPSSDGLHPFSRRASLQEHGMGVDSSCQRQQEQGRRASLQETGSVPKSSGGVFLGRKSFLQEQGPGSTSICSQARKRSLEDPASRKMALGITNKVVEHPISENLSYDDYPEDSCSNYEYEEAWTGARVLGGSTAENIRSVTFEADDADSVNNRSSSDHNAWQNKENASSSSVWTDASPNEDDTDHDATDHTDNSESAAGGNYRHSLHESRWWAKLLHRVFPCCPRPPTMNKVALGVAVWAPCFCCMNFKQKTDRALLGRLNFLVAVFTLYQIGATAFLVGVLLQGADQGNLSEPDVTFSFFAPVLWDLNGQMFLAGLACFVLFLAAALSWRTVHDVNLVGVVRYLWTLQ